MAMASSSAFLKLLLVLVMIISMLLMASVSSAQGEVDLIGEEVEWQPSMTSALYNELGGNGEVEEEEGGSRRSLYWKPMHYYISYGALSANRVPCPPRSGRSYYTHNCFKTRQPANPYTRGCSRITHCRR